jgi:hypothetical protein
VTCGECMGTCGEMRADPNFIRYNYNTSGLRPHTLVTKSSSSTGNVSLVFGTMRRKLRRINLLSESCESLESFGSAELNFGTLTDKEDVSGAQLVFLAVCF